MAIGDELEMRYTLPHFVGYRFGLFNYATKEAGGRADFDDFHNRRAFQSSSDARSRGG
jgi:hypothetical protein